MSLDLLLQAGLTPTQADILGYLLTQDQLKAKEIYSALDKPRGVIYKSLEELIALGLVEKIDKPASVARFRAEHPAKLRSLFEAKEKQAQRDKELFLDKLPALSARYSRASSKSNAQTFEGQAEIQEALDMALQSAAEILTFQVADTSNQKQPQTTINDDFNRKCLKLGIKQRTLVAGNKPKMDSASNIVHHAEVRYLGPTPAPFDGSIIIFDHKLTFQLSSGKQMSAAMLENKQFCETNRAWFEYLWQLAIS